MTNAISSAISKRMVLLAACALLAVAALAAACAIAPAAAYANTGFKDVSDLHWVANEGWLQKAVDRGFMAGYKDEVGRPNGLFGPEDTVTRAQVATVIYRHANPGSDATTASASYGSGCYFRDVADRQYYTAAVQWCFDNNIITGYKDTAGNLTGLFGPNDSVTREQLAAMAARYGAYCDVTPHDIDYDVVHRMHENGWISNWAVDAFAWCASKGIITGEKHGVEQWCNPYGLATRAQLAKIIVALVDTVTADHQHVWEDLYYTASHTEGFNDVNLFRWLKGEYYCPWEDSPLSFEGERYVYCLQEIKPCDESGELDAETQRRMDALDEVSSAAWLTVGTNPETLNGVPEETYQLAIETMRFLEETDQLGSYVRESWEWLRAFSKEYVQTEADFEELDAQMKEGRGGDHDEWVRLHNRVQNAKMIRGGVSIYYNRGHYHLCGEAPQHTCTICGGIALLDETGYFSYGRRDDYRTGLKWYMDYR